MERLATLNLAEREPHRLEELFLYSTPRRARIATRDNFSMDDLTVCRGGIARSSRILHGIR
jgi:hypothetical protein